LSAWDHPAPPPSPTPEDADLRPFAETASEVPANEEWELADFIDAMAASVDRAADTLALKSHARSITYAIRQLDLDVAVTVRRDASGRVLFRTATPGDAGASMLQLNLAQVLESQLTGLRRERGGSADRRSVTTLPSILDEEVERLAGIAIYSIDDLLRYTQTAAMIAEVSRKARIVETRVRWWLGAPFLTAVQPKAGPPGSVVHLEGGNLGIEPGSILYQGRAVEIVSWSPTRVTVRMPNTRGAGVILALVAQEPTNLREWEAIAPHLAVRGVSVGPPQPLAGEPLVFTADLINQGSGPADPFNVRWTILGHSQVTKPHGALQPGQRSVESAVRHQVVLPAGDYRVTFETDPERRPGYPTAGYSSFTLRFNVAESQRLTVGTLPSSLQTLDPLQSPIVDPLGVSHLIFRGLLQPNPADGHPEPDMATSWEESRRGGAVVVTVRLRDRVRFHDGSSLRANDVVVTYRRALEADSVIGETVRAAISEVSAIDDLTVQLRLRQPLASTPISALRIGLAPAEAEREKASRRPVGCGPFLVDDFIIGERLELRAFPDYVLGRPRIDRLTLKSFGDPQEALRALEAYELAVAVVRHTSEAERSLRRAGTWHVTPLPVKEGPLLDVQSRSVHERQASGHNATLNPQLWFTRVGLGPIRRADGRPLDQAAVEPGSAVRAYIPFTAPAPHAMMIALKADSGLAHPSEVPVEAGMTRSPDFEIRAQADARGQQLLTANLGPEEQVAVLRVQEERPARLYALLTAELLPERPVEAAVEVLHADSMTPVRSLPIGERIVRSITANSSGTVLYVLDERGLTALADDGELRATHEVEGGRDVVIGTDDRTAYVTTAIAVIVIDLESGEQRRVSVSPHQPLGIAISRDGRLLAAPAAGRTPALILLDTATLSLERIPITNPGEPTNCATSPNDVAFTADGRVLLWDSNCDNLYQVDPETGTQLTSETIRAGRDSGSSFNYNDMLAYSMESRTAFALKESGRLVILDPEARKCREVGDFEGIPFTTVLSPDGRQLYISVIHRYSGGGPDTLDVYTSDGEPIASRVHTFPDGLLVRSMCSR
jgi:peptide/nickel transport system substrate-binding protein